MIAPWPFAQWGLDIMGHFPIAIRQLKFLVVGIDYFNKLVEAKALATITEKNVRSLVWRNIIYRYGIPRVLISDNGNQFDNNSFKDFCLQLGIKNHYSSPAYPQANEQVEVTNRSLLKIIKTQLEGGKGYMVGRVVERTIGIQDGNQDTYRGDAVSTSIWKQSCYPCRG